MKSLLTLITVLAAGAVGVPLAAASPEPALPISEPAPPSLEPTPPSLEPAPPISEPATPSPQPRVVGGGVDEMAGVGWIAALAERRRYVCSGSLVAPRFVLTAAHCTRGSRAMAWTVRLESKDRADGGVVRRVRRILEFPGYRPAADHGDIALLRLRRPVAVEPVRLVRRGTNWVGEAAYVAGWGQTAARDRRVPRLLRSGSIPIHPGRVCNRQYGWGFHRGAMLCAGAPGHRRVHGRLLRPARAAGRRSLVPGRRDELRQAEVQPPGRLRVDRREADARMA